MKILFVTWDGPGPNYLESLFFPIYERLQHENDVHFHCLQFTWDSEERSESVARAAARCGIGYTAFAAWRKPIAAATLAMIPRGAREIARLLREHDIDVLMPRSTVPAAMCLSALKRASSVKLLFDADGLPADERIERKNASPANLGYRLFRRIEKNALRRADTVVARTQRAKEILIDRSNCSQEKIFVVSNGRDAEQFHPLDTAKRNAIRESLGIATDAPLIVYCGSIGPQYYPREMLRFHKELLAERPDARFVALANEPQVFCEYAAPFDLNEKQFKSMRVAPELVPQYLAAADLGLALRKPTFSQQAVAPIKVGEYLLSGLPVLATKGVGDLDQQLDDSICNFFDTECEKASKKAIRWFLDEVLPSRSAFRDRARGKGLKWFSLDSSVATYATAFKHCVCE